MRTHAANPAPLLLAAVLLAAPAVSKGSLQNQIDTLFDAMANTTAPGVFDTQMRGVLSGGSFQERNRIFNKHVVGFVPPSMGAGCGGLSLYGGSFSFIDLDEFVNLLRGIASNAAGLAFQVAINAIDPLIGQTLENLQKKIQRMNEFLGNSCQLAQGIVTDTIGSFTEKGRFNEGLIAMTRGAVGDLFTGWGDEDGTDAPAEAAAADPARVASEVEGNIVWRALKRRVVVNWFDTPGNDELLEAIMSITGTVIVAELQPAADGQGAAHRIATIPPNNITLNDVLRGGQVTVFRCDTTEENGCRVPAAGLVTLRGIEEQLREVLMGDGGANPGIVDHLIANTTPSAVQTAYMTNAPGHVGTFVRQLALRNRAAAEGFLNTVLPILSLDLAYTVMQAAIQSAVAAVAVDDSPHAEQARDMLHESYRNIHEQYMEARARYGSLQDVVAHYKAYMEIIPERRLYRTTPRTVP